MLLVATDPAFAHHDTGPGHPERVQRLTAAVAGRTPGHVPGGGYDLDALTASVGASLAGVLEHSFRPEPATAGRPGARVVEAAIRQPSPRLTPARSPAPGRFVPH